MQPIDLQNQTPSNRQKFANSLHGNFHPNLAKFLLRIGLVDDSHYQDLISSSNHSIGDVDGNSTTTDRDSIVIQINAKVKELYPPTLQNLRLFHRQFNLHIPFENLSLHWDRNTPVAKANENFVNEYCGVKVSDPYYLEQKICDQYRGGYCFELNQYFYLILREFGYDVNARLARVKWNFPPDAVTGRTHFINVVTFDRNDPELLVELASDAENINNEIKEEGLSDDKIFFLCDVSFGGAGYFEPLRLVYNVIQSSEYDAHRVISLGEDLIEVQIAMITPTTADTDFATGDITTDTDVLDTKGPIPPAIMHKEWRSMYYFNFYDPVALIDVEISNWYVSTFPRSVFVNNIMMNMVTKEGKVSVFNREVAFKRIISDTRSRSQAKSLDEYEDLMTMEKRSLNDYEDFIEMLKNHYKLRIPEGFRISFPN